MIFLQNSIQSTNMCIDTVVHMISYISLEFFSTQVCKCFSASYTIVD